MPVKGMITATTCVLFERTPAIDQVANALEDFEIVCRPEEGGPEEWMFRGPAMALAYRPDVNGLVSVDVVDRPWPDHMGDVKNESMLFGAWSLGQFGPMTYPGGLTRAAQHSWVWAEGRTIADRHKSFVRVRASYVFGALSGDSPVFPEDYDPESELRFVTRVAKEILTVPGALCYFNPNGEVLRDAKGLDQALEYAESHDIPPLNIWCNVRLFSPEGGWLMMDTVGNGQLGLPDLPDLEACMCKEKDYDLSKVDAFLRDTTLYLMQRGEVFRNGDTIDGPGELIWRCYVRNQGLADPPRRTIRFFPDDGSERPDSLFRDVAQE